METTLAEHRDAASMSMQNPRRGMPELLAFGLLPALMVAFVVLAIGFVTRPPGYVARAAFVVDWNEMATVLGDEDVEKVRALWRKKIITETAESPESEEFRWLSVTLTDHTNDRDRFTVEFRAADAAQAEAVVKRVLQEKVSHVKDEAFFGNLIGAALSKERLDELQDDDAKRRRESGDTEYFGSERQEMDAGLSVASNLLGMFGSPVKVVEDVHVESRSGGSVVRVLFAGVFFGGVTGVGGLGLRKIASTPKRPKAAIRAVASAVPPRIPTMSVPPIIARFNMPKPPVMPPPVPRGCVPMDE